MRQTRYSKQRELIYDTLMQSREHPSAEMIYQSLKSGFPSLSLGTVYRNLNLLVEEGRAIRIPSTVNHYDGDIREHPHLFCTACETLYDLSLPVDHGLDAAVETLGHRVSRHELIFTGMCAHCLSKKETQINPATQSNTHALKPPIS